MSVAYVTSTIDAHIVLFNKNGQFQGILIYRQRGEKVAQSVYVMHLLFNGGCHEGSKPPTGHFCPQCRMNNIECLESLFVLVTQGVVDVFDPPVMGNIIPGGTGMEVDHGVIAFSVIDNWF